MVSFVYMQSFHVSGFFHFSVTELAAVTITNLTAHKAKYTISATGSYWSFTVHKMIYVSSSSVAWL
jgi:hypothetical protein